MTANGWFQILFFFALVALVTKPLGIFITRVFSRERTFLDPVLRPIERLIYRVTTVDENHEMPWTEYAVSMLLFAAIIKQEQPGLALFGRQAIDDDMGAVGAAVGFLIGIGIAAWIGRVNFNAPVVPRFSVFPVVLVGSIAVALLSASSTCPTPVAKVRAASAAMRLPRDIRAPRL